MKDLKIRIITAIGLLLVLVPVVFFGGIALEIILGLLTIGAAYELEKMFKRDQKWNFYAIFDIVFSLVTYVSFLFILKYNAYSYIVIYLSLFFLIEGFLMIFTKDSTINTLSHSLLTIFYSSIGFVSMAILRNTEIVSLYRDGLFLICFLFLVCFSTDNFAYVFGSKYGKHPLCPAISPHKTIEGSLAGTIFSLVLPPVFAAFSGVSAYLFSFFTPGWAIAATVLLSLLLSVIDEIGDLFASKLKRNYGIKDYSHIFPGHGGILDRFDSYIFVAVALLILVKLVY